ncbi:MAG TPA: sigma-54 dependent transcriptional regulator [Candidatus Methylacidiphilales bacterium]|jgi:DNA-binding NtrC family response regulator|nr:sigma-54 dependent transcriptional regulator [Candidatus Methylacidiphilales bacterium]
MSPKPLIGIVDDERNIQATLAAILERRGYASVSAFTGRQGLQLIAEHKPDVLLLDLGLPDGEGLDLLRTIRLEHPALPVIVVTANDSLNNAIASIKIGAFHFISKPYVPDELLSLVAKALESKGLRQETVQLREEAERLKKRVQRAEAQLQPIFKNVKMKELFELVEQIAPSEANVLVVGESGVGKEIFANRIHELSPRSGGPLIKLNCAAFPQNMIEGELFGYKKGAFTGASQDFPGMLCAAAEGTLFLDEIAEMPIDLQTRFLRVLQEREFRPLGSTQIMKADFRLIAASNRRPEEAIRLGRLREDLFYRLNTFTLSIPPLRERTEDIPELAQVFLQRFCTKMNKPLLTIQSEAYDALLRYRWPGNVRELQNVIERAVVLTTGSMITRRNLPHEVVHGTTFEPGMGFDREASDSGLSESPPQIRALLTDSQSFNLAEREKAALMAALHQCNGNKKKAAELLGIHRPTLYTKLKKFGLGA